MAQKKIRVKLRHNSGVKGAEGMPGDTVTVNAAQARVWLDQGAAIPADPVERATDDSPDNTEQR